MYMVENNLFFNSTGPNGLINGGDATASNLVDVDPLLDAEYIPQSGSPAIGAADAAIAPAQDIRGWDRDANPDSR